MYDEKISQAKAKLLVEYPYFGTLASRLEVVQNDDIQAFKSDGKILHYNSDFMQEATLSEVAFIFANGAMHAALAHENRKNNRSGWLWQMATDFAINDMLVQNGLEMPDGAQYRKRFHGMYAEEIYAELKDDMLRDGELEYEADDAGDVEQNNAKQESEQQERVPQTKEELAEEILQEKLLAEEALALLLTESKRGDIPESMERFFSLDYEGKIDWREELKVALDLYHKDDYALMPPNKKFLHMGVYMPSSQSNHFHLVIAIDSSGSIDETLLSSFLSEVNFLMSMVQNYTIDLLVCDDKIRLHEKFYAGDTLDVKVIGGGGTDFRPVFTFVEQALEDTKLLLYFSDLEGMFPKEEPNYKVVWITPKECEAPFGKVISLE
jgi:predicted metal-dependent peptidase